MASRNEAAGQMNFQAEVAGRTTGGAQGLRGPGSSEVTAVSLPTGFYRMCFGNHNNRFGGIRVFVNFGVIYEGSEESGRGMEEGDLSSALTGIEVFVSGRFGLDCPIRY